ncbi:Protein kinase domain family protein [Aspergillus niger]|uniref:Protein kinase domain family protein n=1 Tax=Aspergillus niger TaxID=5061 RepID=A0A505HRE0_ASPNG|nr:Protein kinase domain family protein [Aspergillus niger]
MRHHLFLTTISLLSTTATAASTIANIHPAFHDTCPPALSPRAHTHHHTPVLQLHEGTCHPIPITSTHVSFDAQIEPFISPAPNGEDNNSDKDINEKGGIPQHCNVTMHEQPGCVDEPFLAQTVHAGEFGRWVGSECAVHPRRRPCEEASGSPGSGSGDGDGDVHGVNQGEDESADATQQQDKEEEDKVGTVTHGGMVSSSPGVGLNGTTSAVNSTTSPSPSLHAAMNSAAAAVAEKSNGTSINGTSTSSLVHAPLNQTVSWKLMPRRKRGRFSIY